MIITSAIGRLLAAGIALSTMLLPASAATVLNFNSQVLENTVSGQIEKWFADEVTKRTNGEVQIKVFFGESLGRATESLSLLADGAIDLASMSAGFYPAELPLTSAPNSIPMALDTVSQSMKLMTRLLEEVPAVREEHQRHGIRALFFHNLNEYYLLSTSPVTSFADMKGKRMRTWGSEMPKLASAAGAIPVTIGTSELYESLSNGAVDVAPFSFDYIRDYRLYEVAPHISTAPVFVGPTGGVWISDQAWNGLTEEQQRIVSEVSKEALQRDYGEVTAAANGARAYLEEKGVTIHDFPVSELAQWQKANPDFFAAFVTTMDAAGKKEAAEEVVRIWVEVRGATD